MGYPVYENPTGYVLYLDPLKKQLLTISKKIYGNEKKNLGKINSKLFDTRESVRDDFLKFICANIAIILLYIYTNYNGKVSHETSLSIQETIHLLEQEIINLLLKNYCETHNFIGNPTEYIIQQYLKILELFINEAPIKNLDLFKI